MIAFHFFSRGMDMVDPQVKLAPFPSLNDQAKRHNAGVSDRASVADARKVLDHQIAQS